MVEFLHRKNVLYTIHLIWKLRLKAVPAAMAGYILRRQRGAGRSGGVGHRRRDVAAGAAPRSGIGGGHAVGGRARLRRPPARRDWWRRKRGSTPSRSCTAITGKMTSSSSMLPIDSSRVLFACCENSQLSTMHERDLRVKNESGDDGELVMVITLSLQ